MKISKSELKKANKKLAAYNLELECINPLTEKYKCFCTKFNYTDIEFENMNIINAELMSAEKFSDISWLTYFK
jgi:hypothetical protein